MEQKRFVLKIGVLRMGICAAFRAEASKYSFKIY